MSDSIMCLSLKWKQLKFSMLIYNYLRLITSFFKSYSIEQNAPGGELMMTSTNAHVSICTVETAHKRQV